MDLQDEKNQLLLKAFYAFGYEEGIKRNDPLEDFDEILESMKEKMEKSKISD